MLQVIDSLSLPEAYPEPTTHIDVTQTQMSIVFLTDKYAYKIKKPVNLGYVDYTTLENRRYFCQKEIELNRRLCPEIYLGVVPITKKGSRYYIGGEGEVVEYAVRMLRLPEERMMNRLLEIDQVNDEMLWKLSQKLAQFHLKAPTGKTISKFGSIDVISQNNEENLSQMNGYVGRTISPPLYQKIAEFTRGFISQNSELLTKRCAEGKIRDCHGDLHSAHICFTNGICIYDCIEFNDRFRYCDVASELAFLAMDIDHYGKAALSNQMVKYYISLGQDVEIASLLKFYKCYRACVRGKVHNFQLDDPNIEEKTNIQKIAEGYFDLAFAYTWKNPVLFITTGLVGSGKTTLAQALAKNLGAVVLSSDRIRKELAGMPPEEHAYSTPEGGIYSAQFTRTTYQKMFDTAREYLKDGISVILDASFIKREHRLMAMKLAQDEGADFLFLECQLDDKATQERLLKRLESSAISDGRWEIYEYQRKVFEPIIETDEKNRVTIDSSEKVDNLVRKVVKKLSERD